MGSEGRGWVVASEQREFFFFFLPLLFSPPPLFPPYMLSTWCRGFGLEAVHRGDKGASQASAFFFFFPLFFPFFLSPITAFEGRRPSIPPTPPLFSVPASTALHKGLEIEKYKDLFFFFFLRSLFFLSSLAFVLCASPASRSAARSAWRCKAMRCCRGLAFRIGVGNHSFFFLSFFSFFSCTIFRRD